MLKKVVVILERESSKEEAAAFREMLAKEAIKYVWYIAEVEAMREDKSTGAGMEVEEVLQEIEEVEWENNCGILFISSNPKICRLALKARCSCIAYLGGENTSFEGIRYAVESLENIDGRYLDRVCLRHAGLPWEILQTERCLVREMTTEDVDAFYEIYKEPSITAYMEDLYPAKEQEIDYIKNYIKNVYEFFEYGLWTVIEKQSGKIIGRAGLSWREETETVELGYVIAKPFQRQGYAYEVCDAILKYAGEELDMDRVAAYIKEENEASKELCRKLKFRYKGKITIRNASYEKWLKIVSTKISLLKM